MIKNYTVYHLHSDLSSGITNIDSVTKYKQYIERAKECGMTALAFSEHGSVFEWWHKKQDIEKAGMKYIHAIEVYVTESLEEKNRDNYHCILIAKNYEGFKEINQLSSNSFNRKDGHFYYNPRIHIDELVHTSNNIIVTSACLGGILHNGTDSIKEKFITFLKENKERCFLEIQHHKDKGQIEYNQYLVELSKKIDVPLIAGTDTHALNKEHEEARKILQKGKGVHFDNEDGWDLNFKSYNELIQAYKEQQSIDQKYYIEAIQNTNYMADMIEPFDIDTSPKYPKLYKDSEKVFKKKIAEGIKWRGINKLPNKADYAKRIQYELDTYKHNGAIDFMLLEEDYKSAMRKKGIYPGYSRGSVSGSIIAYLLGITEIDSIKHNLNFERFMNTERVSLPDIDSDWYSPEREVVKKYLYEKEGLYCSDIITFNTIALKGAIRDIGRALELPLTTVNEICNNIEVNEEEYRNQYPELFKYVDIVNGVIVSVGNHPAGVVVSPFPVEDWFGTFTTSTNQYPISQINMKEIDSLNFVKLDSLGLDNIGLINETCKLAGIERLTPNNTPEDDIEVWNSIRDDTTMIFQLESNSASQYLKKLLSDETIQKIKAKNPNFSYMDLLSIGNGAIRPAGASYRDELAKGEFRDNGHEALNNMMASTLGFMVFQEQIIRFLHEFCGYTMGEADVVRRCIEENTLILMADGNRSKIKDIEIGDKVVSFNNQGGAEINNVNNKFDNGYQEVFEVQTKHNLTIEATKEHKFLTQRGWIKLKDLTINDYIMSPNRIIPITDNLRLLNSDYYPNKITKIISNGVKHVYDIEVENTHNYVANNMIVHNCFAKKTGTQEHLPKIKAGFIKTMTEKYDAGEEEAEQIIESFLRVIEDASDYLFSLNHSDPYSWIGYICGYLRYHYPYEFITTALNIFEDKEEKTLSITEYAKKRGIQIQPIKFRYSLPQYSFDKATKSIYKGMRSIKYLNKKMSQELYDLRDMQFNDFYDLLNTINSKTSVNSRQLEILIKLDFFSEFGNPNQLLKRVELYNQFSTRHQFSKSDLSKEQANAILKCSHTETEKLYKVEDPMELIKNLDNFDDVKTPLLARIQYEKECLGYINITIPKLSLEYAYVMNVDSKYKNRLVTLYRLQTGEIEKVKVKANTFKTHPIKENTVIKTIECSEEKRWKKTENGFEQIDELETILKKWSDVK